LNEFDFSIHYIPGEMSIVADTLSRIYSSEPNGTVWAPSKPVSDSDAENEDWVFPLSAKTEETETLLILAPASRGYPASAISINHAMKQGLDPRTLHM
jgi:hypothetical protein